MSNFLQNKIIKKGDLFLITACKGIALHGHEVTLINPDNSSPIMAINFSKQGLSEGENDITFSVVIRQSAKITNPIRDGVLIAKMAGNRQITFDSYPDYVSTESHHWNLLDQHSETHEPLDIDTAVIFGGTENDPTFMAHLTQGLKELRESKIISVDQKINDAVCDACEAALLSKGTHSVATQLEKSIKTLKYPQR